MKCTCDYDDVTYRKAVYRRAQRNLNSHDGRQASATCNTDLRQGIVTPYPRQYEINRHVATFRVQ